MSDYTETVTKLRDVYRAYVVTGNEKAGQFLADAAAAIEELQARVSKLEERTKAQQERLEDYMEKQLIIDRWGTKWMTSAKDVPTSAYQHGYADGFAEARAKMEVQDADT